MLTFDPDWRFDSPSTIPPGLGEQFFGLIARCATPDLQQELFEHFKRYFAAAAGTTSSWSSSASWAETDLRSYMLEASANAPLFIEAFYDACQALPPNYGRPNVGRINRLLQDANSGWQIQLPNLVRTDSLTVPIPVEQESSHSTAKPFRSSKTPSAGRRGFWRMVRTDRRSLKSFGCLRLSQRLSGHRCGWRNN